MSSNGSIIDVSKSEFKLSGPAEKQMKVRVYGFFWNFKFYDVDWITLTKKDDLNFTLEVDKDKYDVTIYDIGSFLVD